MPKRSSTKGRNKKRRRSALKTNADMSTGLFDVPERMTNIDGIECHLPKKSITSSRFGKIVLQEGMACPLTVRSDFLSIFVGKFAWSEYVVGFERNPMVSQSICSLQTYIKTRVNFKFIQFRDHIVEQLKGRMCVSSMHLSSVRVREAIIRYCSKEDFLCSYSCETSELSDYAKSLILLSQMSGPSMISSLASILV